MKKRLSALWLGLLLLVGACASQDETETEGPQTITEEKRQTMDPRVGSFLIQAQQAFEQGTYGVALAFTDSAEALAPDLADIHYMRGTIYTQLNQLDVAQAAYQITLENDSKYQGANFNLGLNAFRRGKLRDAINFYNNERDLGETSGLMLEMGRAYAKLGEPDSAKWAYEQAIVQDSTNATAYMWLGQLHEELGELDTALEYSRKGLQYNPESLDYKYIIGSLLYRTEQIEEAATYLEAVAKERPWHHGAQYNLGQVYLRLGQEAESQKFLVRADSAQQLQQKINEAQNAINREPDVLQHWVDLGELLRQSGQIDEAVEAYKVAVSLEPWNMNLQNNLAILFMQSGDFDRAIRRYRAILRIDSTLVDVWFNMGVAYANSGQNEQARQAWEKVLREQPNNPTVRAYLNQLGSAS